MGFSSTWVSLAIAQPARHWQPQTCLVSARGLPQFSLWLGLLSIEVTPGGLERENASLLAMSAHPKRGTCLLLSPHPTSRSASSVWAGLAAAPRLALGCCCCASMYRLLSPLRPRCWSLFSYRYALLCSALPLPGEGSPSWRRAGGASLPRLGGWLGPVWPDSHFTAGLLPPRPAQWRRAGGAGASGAGTAGVGLPQKWGREPWRAAGGATIGHMASGRGSCRGCPLAWEPLWGSSVCQPFLQTAWDGPCPPWSQSGAS